MIQHVRMAIGAAALVVAVGTPACAQARPSRAAVRAERQQERAQASATRPADRQRLEREVRERLWQVVHDRVGLDDQQMHRLRDVNQRLEPQRRQLNQEERATRQALRAEMASASPDGARIDVQQRRLRELQRERLALLDREDAELATFMTPLQRARYHAVQEQLRRRLEQLRERREGALSGAGVGDSATGTTPPG